MSDTPRTDAVKFTVFLGKDNYGQPQAAEVVTADFAVRLERELNESHAREAQLRAALKDATDNCLWRSDSPTPLSEEESAHIYWKAMNALELPAPPVVPFEDVKPLVEVLRASDRLLVVEQDNWHAKAEKQSELNEQALSTFTAKHKP